MTMEFDWIAFTLGMLAGSAAGAAYFAGLAWGVHLALGRARAAAVLLPSAAVRMVLLLIAGWWTAQLGLAALTGFALAFLIMRIALVAKIRPVATDGGGKWS